MAAQRIEFVAVEALGDGFRAGPGPHLFVEDAVAQGLRRLDFAIVAGQADLDVFGDGDGQDLRGDQLMSHVRSLPLKSAGKVKGVNGKQIDKEKC